MAERDVAHRRPAFPPGCLPWKELLHGCSRGCGRRPTALPREDEAPRARGGRHYGLLRSGEAYHQRCFESWRAETTMRSQVCPGCYDLDRMPPLLRSPPQNTLMYEHQSL
ncbi:hypothetical protein E2562_010936 [Oryza meyeriana var. granulata]|uniref:Uncharacterized protein n=1 Tax=Oryza meyeriana var. granulata TaxID=110450 RepID=A0A6G1BUF0_9ORYZ|nr:hypothetical protein E2562_010936 [Oryza meyeriana var. granulata]